MEQQDVAFRRHELGHFGAQVRTVLVQQDYDAVLGARRHRKRPIEEGNDIARPVRALLLCLGQHPIRGIKAGEDSFHHNGRPWFVLHM